MNRGILIRVVPVVVLALFLYWLASPPTGLPAVYSHSDCRKVALTERGTGKPIIGPEDLAVLSGGGRILISAHDRLAPPDVRGGIYMASAFDLEGVNTFSARRIEGLEDEWTRFRPHGIAVDGDQVAIINRTSSNNSTIEIAKLENNRFTRLHQISGKNLCRANDLDFIDSLQGTSLVVTLDRGACGFRFSDVTPFLGSGSIVEVEPGRLPRIIDTGRRYPNGVVAAGGDLIVAETRASRLSRLSGTISLPGGPDNLNITDDGKILAALHPALLHLALYRYGGTSSAPSRIVAVDPDVPQAVQVLFDDPNGSLYSGATSAIISDGVLVAGSVRENGLLVCSQK